MGNRTGTLSTRDYFADGWALFRENILIIFFFIAAIFFADFLAALFLETVKYSFRDPFGEAFDIFTLYNMIIAPLTPMQNIAILSLEILLQIVSGFVNLCGIAIVTARSLLMMNHSECSLNVVRKMLLPNAIRLLKVWLALYLISIAPVYLARFASAYHQFLFFNSNPSNPINNMAHALTGFSILTNIAVAFVLFAVMQYMICYVISGNGSIVRDSFSLAKQTIGKIVLFYIFFELLGFLISLPNLILRFIKPEALMLTTANVYISTIAGTAIMFFRVAIFVVLFFHASKEETEGETENESFEDSFLENETVDSIGGIFRYRVAPSLRFESTGEFHSGLARVKKDTTFGMGKWGYADTEGSLVIPYQYKEAGDFNEGLAAVKKGRYKFYIDKTDEVGIDAGYDEADMFRSGLAVAKIGANEGFIDHDGDMQPLPYDKIYGFSDGLALVHGGSRWSYLDKAMKPVLHVEYEDAHPFSEGLAAVAVMVNKKLCWGYIDVCGNEVIAPQFGQAGLFKEGRASVCFNGKCGHIDKSGEFVTPAEYEVAGDFNDGFAFVKDEYFGYVDVEGIERIPPIYLAAGSFSEGLAWAKTENGWGILEINQYVPV